MIHQRLSTAALHLVAWLGISCAHAAELPEKSIAGSYEVLICKGSCDKDVAVKGRLMLFAAPLQQQQLDRLKLSTNFIDGEPNACFALKKVPGRDYHGYAGINEAGLTVWAIDGEGLQFMLYRSPDAGYRVTVQRAANGFTGTGQSWGAGVAAPQDATLDQVVLRRTGDANPSQCPRQVD